MIGVFQASSVEVPLHTAKRWPQTLSYFDLPITSAPVWRHRKWFHLFPNCGVEEHVWWAQKPVWLTTLFWRLFIQLHNSLIRWAFGYTVHWYLNSEEGQCHRFQFTNSFYNGTALTNVSCSTESNSNRNFCMKFCELIKDWFLQKLSALCKSMPCLDVSREFVPSSLLLLTPLMDRSSKLAEVRWVNLRRKKNWADVLFTTRNLKLTGAEVLVAGCGEGWSSQDGGMKTECTGKTVCTNARETRTGPSVETNEQKEETEGKQRLHT